MATDICVAVGGRIRKSRRAKNWRQITAGLPVNDRNAELFSRGQRPSGARSAGCLQRRSLHCADGQLMALMPHDYSPWPAIFQQMQCWMRADASSGWSKTPHSAARVYRSQGPPASGAFGIVILWFLHLGGCGQRAVLACRSDLAVLRIVAGEEKETASHIALVHGPWPFFGYNCEPGAANVRLIGVTALTWDPSHVADDLYQIAGPFDRPASHGRRKGVVGRRWPSRQASS
jgi:hypothetical protein